ncbi:MAG: elongation factor P [Treponema sp.]|nr:MAG: elongation factor P [Treponema sp.]
MIRGGDIAKGTVLLNKNAPYLVVEREFVNPGKGSAFARVKMKSLKDGSVLTQTIKTADSVEDAVVDAHKGQYQYNDGEQFIFMDTESFEQIYVPEDIVGDKKFFLREGDEYEILIWEEQPIDVKIPTKMIFVVEQSENYIKGDTVSGATKPIVTETGLVVRVPLFIKQGEKILVNTETKEYQERVNK